MIGEWAARRRRAELASDRQLQRLPSARTIARMTTGRDHLSRSDTITVAAIEAEQPTLVSARDRIDGFHQIIRRKMKRGSHALATNGAGQFRRVVRQRHR